MMAAYLNKTIQAARLKSAHTIVTGISDAVAETIWNGHLQSIHGQAAEAESRMHGVALSKGGL